MQKTQSFNFILSLFLLAACLLPAPTLAAEVDGFAVTPGHILMGAQYDGVNLQVNGTVPAGSDVIVRFTGAAEELHLREKGKAFGLLWMNIGKVTLKNVPKACLIDSSRPFEELGKVAAPYRLDGLRDAIEIEDGGSGALDIAHELLLLKKHGGLYREAAKGITLGADEGAHRTFSASLPIPSAISPGNYQVEAIAVKDGVVVGKYTEAIRAELSGFPLWLYNLAFEKSLLYGVLATVIALVSGLAIGLVFQSKGAH